MKKFLAVLAILAAVLFFAASRVLADNTTVGVENTNTSTATATGGNANQNQNQSEQQQQKQKTSSSANFTDDSRSLGMLPQATTHGIGTAVIPMNEYGHLITQMGTGQLLMCETTTMANFNTMVDVMGETTGAQKWSEINGKIIPYPVVKRRFRPMGDKEPVFFVNPELLVSVLNRVTDNNLVGLLVYNSKFDKKNPLIVPHFKARSYLDASRSGANVVISVDQFFQGYFVPEGMEISVGGLLSWVSKVFLSGGSIAGNAGMAKQQNTEFGRPGAAFIFFRIDNPEEICYPPPPPRPRPVFTPPPPPPAPVPPKCDENRIREKIREFEQKVQQCTRFCLENLGYRSALGELYIDLYICTGDRDNLRKAIEQFEIAERNYFKGWDIKQYQSEADRTIARVYYNWAGTIRELFGRESAMNFAREKQLERIPAGFER